MAYLLMDKQTLDEVVSGQIIKVVGEYLRHNRRTDGDPRIDQILSQLNVTVTILARDKSTGGTIIEVRKGENVAPSAYSWLGICNIASQNCNV